MSEPEFPETRYPVPRPESGNDPRFCFGLLHDAAQLLEAHGYPPLTGRDVVRLSLALFQVIYAPETQEATACP